MLSTRARIFLATLERRPSIPTKEVEAIIRDQGYPCFSPWLDFHERYAGYLEVFGQDWAVWGLVHEKPVWLLPRKADIDREPHEETWYVTCADTHPSYDYRLDDKGEFLGPPAESFDIHVERIALGWDFHQKGPSRVLTTDELRGPGFQEIFITQIEPHLVAEASDRFFRYYMNENYLVVEDVESGRLLRARQRTQSVTISGT
jgi:hypothetical protein